MKKFTYTTIFITFLILSMQIGRSNYIKHLRVKNRLQTTTYQTRAELARDYIFQDSISRLELTLLGADSTIQKQEQRHVYHLFAQDYLTNNITQYKLHASLRWNIERYIRDLKRRYGYENLLRDGGYNDERAKYYASLLANRDSTLVDNLCIICGSNTETLFHSYNMHTRPLY